MRAAVIATAAVIGIGCLVHGDGALVPLPQRILFISLQVEVEVLVIVIVGVEGGQVGGCVYCCHRGEHRERQWSHRGRGFWGKREKKKNSF